MLSVVREMEQLKLFCFDGENAKQKKHFKNQFEEIHDGGVDKCCPCLLA